MPGQKPPKTRILTAKLILIVKPFTKTKRYLYNIDTIIKLYLNELETSSRVHTEDQKKVLLLVLKILLFLHFLADPSGLDLINYKYIYSIFN